MQVATIIFSIIFILLLVFAFFLICAIYVCDTYECKPFNVANTKEPPGTEGYILALLTEMFNDGIWAFPFVGAAIATPISLLLLGVPITIKNFTIMFLIIFIVTYFLFSFFGHHYIKPLSEYIAEYIKNNPPANDLQTTNFFEPPPFVTLSENTPPTEELPKYSEELPTQEFPTQEFPQYDINDTTCEA